jgi:flavin-dependent dehydrogenase
MGVSVADSFDAIVIGGGPAGATSALLMARAGWSVAVVERAAFPRRKVCGEFLSATNLPLLRHLGVEGAFLDLAGPEVTRVGVFARDRRIIAEMPCLQGEERGWGHALGREHLDAMLLERAAQAGAEVFQPWTVTRVQADPAGHHSVQLVCGDTRRELELRGRVLIAAHGSWDPGQLSTQPARRPPRASDLFGFKAHLRGSGLPSGLMPLLAFPGGYGGMVHSDHGRVSLSCCIRRDQLEHCRQKDRSLTAGEAVLAHIVSTCSAARGALDGATPESEWRSAGPIRPGIRATSQAGVFLAGNAAGEAHPVVAEGISMAMQSGLTLAHALTTTRTLDQARELYARDWHRLFARRIHAAAVIAHWAMRPAAVALMLPLLSAFPGMLTEGARTSGKVTAICSPSF